MGEAAFWAFVGASSLIIGAELAFVLKVSRTVLGIITAFGVGALISAVAYELVAEAIDGGDTWVVVAGLTLGSITFFVGDLVIDRMGGAKRKSSQGEQADGRALAVVLGSVLDGIPESIVLGMSLVLGGGVSVGLLAGIFVSNLPEAMSASSGLIRAGWERSHIRRMWWLIAGVSTASAAIGYAALANASAVWGELVQSFAAGALLTMIADTMAPQAFDESGDLSGLATTLGFIVALAISTAT